MLALLQVNLKFFGYLYSFNIERVWAEGTDLLNTLEYLATVFPKANGAYPMNENFPIIETPNATYAIKDLPKLFELDGQGWVADIIAKDRTLHNLFNNMDQHPGVSVDCIYTLGLPTIFRLRSVQNEFWDRDLEEVTTVRPVLTDGDGNAPIHSLRICDRWSLDHKKDIKHRARVKVFHGVPWLQTPIDSEIIDYILGVINQRSSELT